MAAIRPRQRGIQTRVFVFGKPSSGTQRALERARSIDPEAASFDSLDEIAIALQSEKPDILLVAEGVPEDQVVQLKRTLRAAGATPEIWVATGLSGLRHDAGVLRVGDLKVDPETRRATFKDELLDLRAKLFDFARLLCERGERGASYDDVSESINRGYGGRALVQQDASELRRRLRGAASMLWTKRDFGYAIWPTRPEHFGSSGKHRRSRGSGRRRKAREK